MAVTRFATFEDLLVLDDADRIEIIDGELVHKAVPTFSHGESQAKIILELGEFTRRRHGRPAGWWLAAEVHVEHRKNQVYCHDVLGWRRDRHPQKPSGWPVRMRPDWVCEIVSPKHEKRDLVDKPAVLHGAEVAHLWLVNPEEEMLHVQRWSPGGYTTVLAASSDQTVWAEPFEAIEFRVGVLFGNEYDDDGYEENDD